MATGTGTGTPVTAGSAPNLAGLRSQVRLTLPSTTDWPDATLDKWIGDAIRLYSAQLPRTWRHALSLTTGTQEYALPGGHSFRCVLSVEYPVGQVPQVVLRQVDPWNDAFTYGYPVYAVLPVDDATVLASDDTVEYILFAQAVSTGETARIPYLAGHPVPTQDADYITVPTSHWEALIAFVDVRAHWELEVDEAASPETSPSTVHLSQLGEEGRRAWNRFKEVMNVLASLESGRSAVLPWWPGSAI
jgi:hypothetical protein